MLLPFLLLGGKMNNCQLFIFQVNEIELSCKCAKNKRIYNKKCHTLLPDVRAVHARNTKITFDNKSSSF